MRIHGRSMPLVSLVAGLLACVASWSVAPVARAVTGERERRLEPAPRPKAPPRAAVETATVREAAATDRDQVAGCRRLSSSRPLKLNLKPDTDIADLVSWISSITCRQFLLPATILANPRKVTVYAPQVIAADGAYRLFLSALDSVGLTVQESGRFLRIIEASKAKNGPTPLYGFGGELLSTAPHQGPSDGQTSGASSSAEEVSRQ
jgi:GspD-like, N0 domain